MATFNLRNEIVGLIDIHANGQLQELLLQHAAECRAAGLPLDSQLAQPVEPIALDIARASVQLHGVEQSEALAIARDLLKQHPRRDIGVELVAFFLDEKPNPKNSDLAPLANATARKLARARGKSN